MNKYFYCIFLFVVLILASCSFKQMANSKAEVKITGKWDIQSISSNAVPDSSLLKDFGNMLHTLLINANIEFYADHKFIAQIAGRSYSGNWQSDAKASSIKLIEAKKESTYSFDFSKENEIKLSGKEGKQDFTIKLVREGQKNKAQK